MATKRVLVSARNIDIHKRSFQNDEIDKNLYRICSSWFFLTMMVFVTAPDDVSFTSGESIYDQTKIAIAFQIFGFLCMIIAIISILVAGLKKL